MATKDYLPSGGLANASYTVKFIVVLLWSPIFIILNALAIGIAATVVGIGKAVLYTGEMPAWVLQAGSSVTGNWLTVAAIVAPIAFIYLVLSNYTFGESTVNAGFDQATDLKDEVDG